MANGVPEAGVKTGPRRAGLCIAAQAEPMKANSNVSMSMSPGTQQVSTTGSISSSRPRRSGGRALAQTLMQWVAAIRTSKSPPKCPRYIGEIVLTSLLSGTGFSFGSKVRHPGASPG